VKRGGRKHKGREPRAKDTLEDLGVRPSKGRGQNFLIDDAAIGAIVAFGDPQPEETLVEIGPGLGALTKALSRLPRLTVIEIEPRFCEELAAKFPGITILNEDIRMVDLSEIGDRLVVFGNLPYSFSTDIVFHLVEHAPWISRAVLLLQREFAERLAAPPGGKSYGVLSISCQLSAEVRLGPVIKGDSFHPPTQVDSQIVELKFRKEPLVPQAEQFWFLFTPQQIAEALGKADIDGGRRAETLSIAEFIRLAKVLAPSLRAPRERSMETDE
jgi:16S rRNA (adenine1518-N6/adenine1519-N6)-dimethyltransferase